MGSLVERLSPGGDFRPVACVFSSSPVNWTGEEQYWLDSKLPVLRPLGTWPPMAQFSPRKVLQMVKAREACHTVVSPKWPQGSHVLKCEAAVNRLAGKAWSFLTCTILFLLHTDSKRGEKFFRQSILQPIIHAIGFASWAIDVDLLYQLRMRAH